MEFDTIQNMFPEIFLSISAMVLLLTGAFLKGEKPAKTVLIYTGIVFALTIGILLNCSCTATQSRVVLFDGTFICDDFSNALKILISLLAIGVIIISLNDKNYAGGSQKCFEFPILVILAVIGSFLLISASDLLIMYLGLELMSLSSYVMVAINRDNEKATEAGLKYFILGALASCLILFGASLIYGFVGSTNFTDMNIEFVFVDKLKELTPAITIGVVLVITGFFFKISAVPMHMWAPDVYEGSTKSVLSFISTIPKIASIAFLIRLTSTFPKEIYAPFGLIFTIVAGASMIVGAFAALKQENIKRLLAYSSIANIGFVLVPISIGGQEAYEAALLYIGIYSISVIGLLALITSVQKNGEDFSDISSLAGLSKTSPLYALAFSALLFSVAGIPPLAGFWAKFYVFTGAIGTGAYAISIIGIISSVVACFYYLRIIKVIYFDSSSGNLSVNKNIPLNILIGSIIVFNLAVSLYIAEIMELIEDFLYSLY